MYRNSTLPVLRLLIEPYRAKHENGMEHRRLAGTHTLHVNLHVSWRSEVSCKMRDMV